MLRPAPSAVSQTKEYILKASVIERSWKIDVPHQKREREKINLCVHSALANCFKIIVSHPNYKFPKGPSMHKAK